MSLGRRDKDNITIHNINIISFYIYKQADFLELK